MALGRYKFIIGGMLILAAVIYLIASSTGTSAEYFITVDELQDNAEKYIDRNLRVSGAVVGDTIQYDPQTMNLTFQVAHVPGDNDEIEARGGLALVLHEAVTDRDRSRLMVVYNGPKPDLLDDETQAILSGHLDENGVFYADELLLKCPTKYEQALPEKVEGDG